jgi:hypothetical protein
MNTKSLYRKFEDPFDATIHNELFNREISKEKAEANLRSDNLNSEIADLLAAFLEMIERKSVFTNLNMRGRQTEIYLLNNAARLLQTLVSHNGQNQVSFTINITKILVGENWYQALLELPKLQNDETNSTLVKRT